MKKLNNIFKMISQMEKNANEVNLGTHEVELGLVEDLKTQFNKYFSVDNMDVLELEIIDAVKKLNANYVASTKEFEAFDKIYNEFRKKALELGVEIPKDVIQYKDEIFKFMKAATEQHKKYLNIKL